MARNVLADAGFLVAYLNRLDGHHEWAAAQAEIHPPPWKTCEGVVGEVFCLLGRPAVPAICALLRTKSLVPSFDLSAEIQAVTSLLERYASVPMDFADACLVRMSEQIGDAVILTTDSDFRIYRRHGRKTVPCVLPR